MPRDTAVTEIMTTEVLTFRPADDIRSAMKQLVDRDVDAGPVVDADGRVLGMLSTADLVVRDARFHLPTVINLLGVNVELPHKSLDEEVAKALGSTVGEVMNDKPITIGSEATVEDAATLMHNKDVSRLSVTDSNGTLVGIVARGDIVRLLVREE